MTRAMLAKRRTRKIAIATMLTLFLAASMLAVALPPTAARKPTPQTWTLRLPGGYVQARGTFIQAIPSLSTSAFRYYNPNLPTAPGSPSLALSINLDSAVAKTTDYGTYENWHLEAKGVDCAISIPIMGTPIIRVASVKCRELVADVNMWPPTDENPEFGRLKATLKGEVFVAVSGAPGSPIPAYGYQGPELVIDWTFIEPRYLVTATEVFNVPQGWGEEGSASVEPQEPGITGPVGLGFELKNGGGIHCDFKIGGGQPPFTVPLKIWVEPWVPTGTYTGWVVVTDYYSGKRYYSNPMTINVQPSGYEIWVAEATPTVDLGPLERGTIGQWPVEVKRISPYTSDVGLNWRPTEGDFSNIGVGFDPGGGRPDFSSKMTINVGPTAPLDVHRMDVFVWDSGLNKEFVCHVTFAVVEPGG